MTAPRTVVSGGTGFVGRFIVERLLAEGHAVTVAGRSQPADRLFSAPVAFAPLDLGAARPPEGLFDGAKCFVHAAFDHLPGRYRGGEGDDPEGFRRRNIDGSAALFRAAKAAGAKRAVFLSSRAVYGDQLSGVELGEATEPRPNSLYGEVKLACERELAALADEKFCAVSLRVTGVYGPAGPGEPHKWSGLIADYLAGRPVASRAGTEVHGDDVAWAVLIALTVCGGAQDVYNVSDIVVDHADVLAVIKEATGCAHPLPERADAGALNIMSAKKLKGLGWRPGGRALFEATMREMISARAPTG